MSFLIPEKSGLHNSTAPQRALHVKSILRWYVKDHVISTYFFDVISLIEKSTLFPCTFFDVTSMVEKSLLFPRIFFDAISVVK